MTVKKITPELLREWDACKDGYEKFCKLLPRGGTLKEWVNVLIENNHEIWACWLFVECKTRGLFVEYTSQGFRNTGNHNTGNRNTGNGNTGDWNSGNRNTGDISSGDWNKGNRNSGDKNSGNRNTGNRNSGNGNSGNRNTGNGNSGNGNTGSGNSGNWNTGNRNSGFLNSTTPTEIRVFNKPLSIVEWGKATKPKWLCFDLTELVETESGVNLVVYSYQEAAKKSWDKATKEDRELTFKLPNFDLEVFQEIFGFNPIEELKND